MISVILYGRNDAHGYNLHKRAAISLNAIAEVLTDPNDEMIFVDYNTADDLPTFPEAIADTLTGRARAALRVLRVRPEQHEVFAARTHLVALEPVARNVALRRSNPANRWVLSTNTDMIFITKDSESLSDIVGGLQDGFYHAPRFELPESLWEGYDRRAPVDYLEQTARWASRLHLEEIVRGSEDILFDGPGDFQLALREDLHRIHGFHEEMILGWHVDANLARRMRLLRGKISSLHASVKAYHCDHTRQSTLVHRHDRAQNDPARFVDGVHEPGIPDQAQGWGLAEWEVEEVDLTASSSNRWLEALDRALPAPPARPYESSYVRESYNDLGYEPAHVAPFVTDLVAAAAPNTTIGYAGARSDTHRLLKACIEGLGRSLQVATPPGFDWLHGQPMASNDDWRARAGIFIFEFGAEPGVECDDRLRRVVQQLDWLAYESPPDRPAKVIAVNAIHNRFEKFITGVLNPTATPFSSRIRHGYISAGASAPEVTPGQRAVAALLLQPSFKPLEVGASASVLERMERHPSVEVAGTSVRLTTAARRGHALWGPYLALRAGGYRCTIAVRSASKRSLLPLLALEVVLGRKMVERLSLRGDDLASGAITVDFVVAPECVGEEFEMRVTSFCRAEVIFDSIQLHRLS